MRQESLIKPRSFDFAVRIVNLYKLLTDTRKEFDSINNDAVELMKMISATVITMQKRLGRID